MIYSYERNSSPPSQALFPKPHEQSIKFCCDKRVRIPVCGNMIGIQKWWIHLSNSKACLLNSNLKCLLNLLRMSSEAPETKCVKIWPKCAQVLFPYSTFWSIVTLFYANILIRFFFFWEQVKTSNSFKLLLFLKTYSILLKKKNYGKPTFIIAIKFVDVLVDYSRILPSRREPPQLCLLIQNSNKNHKLLGLLLVWLPLLRWKSKSYLCAHFLNLLLNTLSNYT